MAPTLIGTPTTASGTGSTVTTTAPIGTQSGDVQLVWVAYPATTALSATPSGWTLVRSQQNTSDPATLALYVTTTITASQAFGRSGSTNMVAIRMTYRDAVAPVAADSTSTTGTSSSQVHTLSTISTTVDDSKVVAVAHSSSGGSATTYTAVSPWTLRAQLSPLAGGTYTALGVLDTVKATAGSQGGTVNANRDDENTVMSVVLDPVAAPTAPTVGAGADVGSHTVSTQFSRTATENDNGSAITSRAWTIEAGPTGVGTTIGTAAALSWTPGTVGSYTLRYSATNSVGTGTDDMLITVVSAAAGPTVRGRSSGVITTGTTSHAITLPTQTQAGDSILVWFANDEQTDPTSAVADATSQADGWVSLASVKQGTGTNHRGTLFHLPAAEGGGLDALTVTTTGAQESAYIGIALVGADTPIVVTSNAANTTGQTPPAHATLASNDYLSLVLLALDQNPAADQTIGVPAGYGDLVEAEFTVGSGGVSAFSMEAFFTGVTSITPGAMTWTSNEQSVIFHVAIPPAAVPTAPTVGAGTDVGSHTVSTQFSRTATENDNGAAITSRAWTIESGPTGVGTTIGTAAALSWTPTVTGTYVLEYAATNSAGTGTDTMQIVVVAALVAPGSIFDLSRWHLTLPTEDPGPDTDAEQVNQPELDTHADANFYADELNRMVCIAPVVGFTTSGSGGTRGELREHESGSYANSAWDPSTTGRRQLTLTTYVDATSITGGSNPRQEAICAQIHGAGSSPIPLILSAEYHVTPARIQIFKNGPGFASLVEDITPETPITIRIRVENGRLKLWGVAGQVADLAPLTAPQHDWPISDFTDDTGWYFKAGIYNKTTVASGSTGEAVAKISYLEVLQPGDAEPPIATPGGFLPFFAA